MQKTINFINSFGFESILSLGVGIPSLFYDKLNAKDKICIYKYDFNSYPRWWTKPTKRKDIKKWNLKIIKRWDVNKYFKNISSSFTIYNLDDIYSENYFKDKKIIEIHR